MAHKATDLLSADVNRVMISGFRSKLTYSAIARQLADLGANVPERTIARRGQEWREEEARRRAAKEQMTALVEAMREGNWSAAEMIGALATDALMMNPEALTGADPLKVQRQNLQAEALRIKRGELEVKQRAVQIDETRLNALLERERRAAEVLRPEAAMSPEERIEEIRSIYGIARPTQ